MLGQNQPPEERCGATLFKALLNNNFVKIAHYSDLRFLKNQEIL
jgi:hypothetical protein